MAWKYTDVGTLGGAEFYMSRHSHQGQHRVAVHKYPESNRVDYVKQGRDEFKFTISAYVIGGKAGAVDYDIARDKLWNVLRRGGQTTLLHPYLGLKQVHIRSFSFNENQKDGNIAQFRMTLSEVEPKQAVSGVRLPDIPTSLVPLLNLGSFEFLKDVEIGFTEGRDVQFNPSMYVDKLFGALKGTAPFRWLDTASGWLETAGDVLEGGIAAIRTAQSQTRGLLEYKRQLSRIYTLQDRLLVESAELYDNILALLVVGYNPYGQFTTESYTRFTELLKVSNFNAFDRNSLTNIFHTDDADSEKAQRVVNTETDRKYGDYDNLPTSPSNIIRTAGLFAMIQQAGTMNFADVTQLDIIQQETMQAIDNFLSNEDISTNLRRVIMQLKAGCMEHFRRQRGLVGTLTPIIPQVSTNAILVAYNETGSYTSSDGIVLSNAIENPFFLEAGDTINIARSI